MQLEKRFEYIVNTSEDFITLINRKYHYEVVNESYIHNIGIPREEILGKHVSNVWGEKLFIDTIKGYLDRCLEGEEIHYVERFEFGPAWKYMHVSYYPYQEKDSISHVLVFSHDITHMGEIEAKLINYEFRDPLTGLFNGRSLEIILEMELEKADRMVEQDLRALLFISISNLQDVQLCHGHTIGNMLLENTGIRIKELLRESDYVFRYEGNELVIILSCLSGEYGPAVVAKKIHDVIKIPYRNGEHDISFSCHIGIALYPKDGETPQELMNLSAEALRRAIQEDKPYIMYNRSIHDRAVSRMKLESDMIRAFENDQFQLSYQPIVNEKGEIKGCETLIRWNHPERGIVPPGDFIPIAEKSGLIKTIGKWVIFQTLRNMKVWSEEYEIYTSINLTAQEFEDKDIQEILQTALKQAGIQTPHLVRLECTESMEIIHTEEIIAKMQSLCEVGFEIFLDDFGTGYSSLSYLKHLPASTLKLDKSFIDGIENSKESRDFLKLIVYLAKSLDKRLIVEGVETEEQFRILTEEGCTLFQGYFFSGPVGPQDLKALLDSQCPLPQREGSNTNEEWERNGGGS